MVASLILIVLQPPAVIRLLASCIFALVSTYLQHWWSVANLSHYERDQYFICSDYWCPIPAWIFIDIRMDGTTLYGDWFRFTQRYFSRTRSSSASIGSVKPFFMALCVGLCTTCYVFVDKLNLEHISAISLLEVTNIGFVAALTPTVIASKQLRTEWKLNSRIILLGAILNPGSYLLFLLQWSTPRCPYLPYAWNWYRICYVSRYCRP